MIKGNIAKSARSTLFVKKSLYQKVRSKKTILRLIKNFYKKTLSIYSSRMLATKTFLYLLDKITCE